MKMSNAMQVSFNWQCETYTTGRKTNVDRKGVQQVLFNDLLRVVVARSAIF